MADELRSTRRQTATSFRMSEEDYATVKQMVADGGYRSIQELLEVRVFGKARPLKPKGPKPKARQEERLDLTA